VNSPGSSPHFQRSFQQAARRRRVSDGGWSHLDQLWHEQITICVGSHEAMEIRRRRAPAVLQFETDAGPSRWITGKKTDRRGCEGERLRRVKTRQIDERTP
jgi:hypothetical protein